MTQRMRGAKGREQGHSADRALGVAGAAEGHTEPCFFMGWYFIGRGPLYSCTQHALGSTPETSHPKGTARAGTARLLPLRASGRGARGGERCGRTVLSMPVVASPPLSPNPFEPPLTIAVTYSYSMEGLPSKSWTLPIG
jgi:hypothetical protein